MVRFRPPGSSTWYNVSSDAGARAATAIESAKKATTSKSSSYRGPTVAQIKAGTLAATPATTAHRESARTTALTQSGIRSGQTPAQAVAEATTTVYGAASTQAKRAQAIFDKQKADIARGTITSIQDLPKSPHDITLTTAQIHRREQLFEDAKRETLIEALKGKAGEIIKYQVDPLKEQIRRQNLELQSKSSKIQTQNAQFTIYENRLDKYNIVDGKFVGTEKQYEQYKKDYQKYTNKYNQLDSSIVAYNTKLEDYESKRTEVAGLELKAKRAKYGGLAGKYEEAERKTAAQLKAEKAEFKEKHPQTVKQFEKLYDVIKKTSELQVVGPTPSGIGTVTKIADPVVTGLQLDEQSIDAVITLSKREGFKGFAQQALAKPVKKAAMVGIGIITAVGLPVVTPVAVTLGAGRKAAIVGKGIMAGLGGLYVVGTGQKYIEAGTPYERGAVLGEAIFQEIIPLFAGGYIGTKAITAAPKVTKIVIRKAGFISKKFKAGTKAMLADNKAMINAGKTAEQRLVKLVKSEEKRLGRPLLESEYNALKALVVKPKTVKTAKDIFKKIDEANARKVESGEYKEVKIGTGAQQQIQLVRVVQKPLTKQSIKEVVKLKEQFELTIKTVIKPKVTTKPIQKVKVATDARKTEALRLKQQSAQRQAAYQKEMQALADQMPAFKRKVVVKTIQKQVLKDKSITKQITELKQQYRQKLITKQVYEQKLAQLTKQALKLTQSQKQTLKQAQLIEQGFAQKMINVVAVMQIFKTATATKASATTKAMVKAVQKEKQRMAVLQISALTYKQMISRLSTITSVSKAITEAKPAKKYIPPRVPKKPVIKKVKIILPITPPIEAPKKKKHKIKKKRVGKKGYTPYEIRSRIATLHDMFG